MRVINNITLLTVILTECGADHRARTGHGRASARRTRYPDRVIHAGEGHRHCVPRHPGRGRAFACHRSCWWWLRVPRSPARSRCSWQAPRSPLFTVAALGILLGTITTYDGPVRAARHPSILVIMQRLSGSGTPIESMPIWLQYLIQIISPTPHFRRLLAGGIALSRGQLIGGLAALFQVA